MAGDVEMDDVPPMVLQDDQAIQDLEWDGRDGEEVNVTDLFGIVLQESPPRLRRRIILLGHVFGRRRESASKGNPAIVMAGLTVSPASILAGLFF